MNSGLQRTTLSNFAIGTVLTGDLVSVSGMEVQVRVAGALQTLDRNRVKRILLIEREPTSN